MAYNRNIFSKGTVTYSDFDLSFKTNPLTNDIRKKTDLEAIKQSLKNILFTNVGERPFRPSLAGRLNNLLFEPLDEITTNELDLAIRTAINNYEPRVEILDLDIVDNPDENALDVTLYFNMVNVLEPQEINIILKRIR